MPETHSKQYMEYFPEINRYVPAMGYAGDISEGGIAQIDFGAPAVSAADNILNDQSINAAVTVQRASLLSYRSDARFGRNLRVIASGAATSTVDVYGRDCYGQPMRETLTLNGNTKVDGVKAFYVIDRIVFGATSSTTVDVGWNTSFGLPYKTTSVIKETADGVTANAGTLTAPVLTDPQTATTGDPRGRYVPTTTPDGSKQLSIVALCDDGVNASGNGGLMGIAHKGS